MRGKRRSTAALLGLLATLPLAAQQPGPPSTGGVARLDFLLQHLAESRRVLLIGAHPDDEDTYLLTWASRHFGADAAYLSLTRGEGGQNLIGDELGTALGLLRTRELEAARGIDGGRQFFTRAIDFGYTRSLAETRQFWPPDSLLKDVVRVIRRFRPHVIVTVFPPTPQAGHGQHQYSAWIGQQAYRVAGDPSAYPELAAEEQLEAWAPLRLFQARAGEDETTLRIQVGVMDHRVGKTIRQIAQESRSQHRSQDFGTTQPIGPLEIRLRLVDDRTGAGSGSLFAGVPLEETWLTRLADSLRRHVAPALMPAVARHLAEALDRADPAQGTETWERLRDAVVTARGLLVDARADRAAVVDGEHLPATLEWSMNGETREDSSGCVRCGPLGQPYFLRRPSHGAMYDWTEAAGRSRGLPMDPPVAVSMAGLPVPTTRVPLRVPLTVRTADQATGEIREPVRVVPRLGVALAPDLLIWPASDDAPRTFTVTLTHFAGDTTRGRVALVAEGWTLPAPQQFVVAGRGTATTVTFTVRRPPMARGGVPVRAVATTEAGERFDATVRVIAYPHIQPVQYLTSAEAAVEVAPIRLPAAARIGYVRGAADRIPEVLQGLGLPLVLLDTAALGSGDLAAFDVIVIGPRAYETDSAVVRHNGRLLAYVRQGGRLVVQYQQYDFSNGGYAPYALRIHRPHDRITDETAPVTMLDARHAVFTRPNRLDDADWRAWPQERGLYFAGTWGGEFTPLLEMRDPEMEAVRGGLLVARYGAGSYAYTGISFFRAIPAGNPGALRLFLNLIDLRASDLE